MSIDGLKRVSREASELSARLPPEPMAQRPSEELLKILPPHAKDLDEVQMSDEQLLALAEYCRRNCEPHDDITYDGRMIFKIVPELIRRLEQKCHE